MASTLLRHLLVLFNLFLGFLLRIKTACWRFSRHSLIAKALARVRGVRIQVLALQLEHCFIKCELLEELEDSEPKGMK
jgi:L-cystine uptake protein TcyP (sodium:dicarboxylate symporter family)